VHAGAHTPAAQLPEQQPALVVQGSPFCVPAKQATTPIKIFWHVEPLQKPEQHWSPSEQAVLLLRQFWQVLLPVALQRCVLPQHAWRALSHASPEPLQTHAPPTHSKPEQHSALAPQPSDAALQVAQLP
jgi:hypothetical protein